MSVFRGGSKRHWFVKMEQIYTVQFIRTGRGKLHMWPRLPWARLTSPLTTTQHLLTSYTGVLPKDPTTD